MYASCNRKALSSPSKPVIRARPAARALKSREPTLHGAQRFQDARAARVRALRSLPETTQGTSVSPNVSSPPPATAPATPSTPSVAAPDADATAGLVRGQGTAIVTGAVSVLVGAAYLALVYFMDARGGQMLPPPPEAFIP